MEDPGALFESFSDLGTNYSVARGLESQLETLTVPFYHTFIILVMIVFS